MLYYIRNVMRCWPVIGSSFLIVASLAAAVAQQLPDPNPVFEPHNIEPFMTASLSPGAMTANENSYFFRTFSVQDQDKVLKTANNSVVTIAGGLISINGFLLSSSTPALVSLTSSDNNTGTWNFAVTAKARHVDAETLYQDDYNIVDNANMFPILKDPYIALGQFVVVQNVP